MRKNKILFPVASLLIATSSTLVQGSGIAGITEAINMVTSYFDPGTRFIYAIRAVVGLIGGIKVYNKFLGGDPDISKTAASWFGAHIFLIVTATILRSFFLQSNLSYKQLWNMRSTRESARAWGFGA